MRIGVLGPLEVRSGDEVVEVAGARLRALLIALALEPGQVVPLTRLVYAVWGESPPSAALNAVQALVSRLRRQLPGLRVESHPAGYLLAVEPDDVDAVRFARLVAAGDTRAALELWRGPALTDVADSAYFAGWTARLTELRLTALEDLPEAAPVAELAALVADHPLRERLAAALMRSLRAAGRTAEALAVYERTRTALADELGVDPSPELRALVRAPSRTNLRPALTSFVGREADVAEVAGLVADHRLVTLTGPGGSGKTRLATEAAGGLLGDFPDGVWLAELAQVTAGEEIPRAVLDALGARGPALSGPRERLVEALRGRHALLVLDNCEHLVDDAAALADLVLGACPELRILATSREPLGLAGEAVRSVEPLALDEADPAGSPAVRLLLDRAGPGTRPDLGAVVRICRALDGMPLAIELAAARLRTMPADQVADRLDARFQLLTGGSRAALPRHRTLLAVVDWSWDLLSDPERALLRRVAAFSGGASVAAAERVCGVADTLELLGSLADKSLLVPPADREPRYRLLETIREYGLRRLAEAGETEAVRRAHADYFAELAERADPHLRGGDQARWMASLSGERDNLDAAVRAAVAAGDPGTVVRLLSAAGWFWYLDWALSGRRAEGVELAARVLADHEPAEDGRWAVALGVGALFELNGLGDERLATRWLAAAGELAGRTGADHPVLRIIAGEPGGDPWAGAMGLLNRGIAAIERGDPAAAERDLEPALAEFHELGDRLGITSALTALAGLAARRGDLGAAVARQRRAIEVVTELVPGEDAWLMRLTLSQLLWIAGDRDGSALVLRQAEGDAARIGLPDARAALAYARAEFARWAGHPVAAAKELGAAVELSRHARLNWHFRAMLGTARGYLAADAASAAVHHREALDWALRSRGAPAVAQALVGVADLAVRRGLPYEAAKLLAAAVAIRGGEDRSQPDELRLALAASEALGDTDLAAATAAGARATLTTARALAAPALS